MDPHFLMNMEEDSLSFPPYYLENYEWGKKISKFERKSMSHTKLLQHLSYFLSLPFSKEHKGIFVIIYFSLLLDVRTRVKKLEILEGRQE
jgi:hypothetical protein